MNLAMKWMFAILSAVLFVSHGSPNATPTRTLTRPMTFRVTVFSQPIAGRGAEKTAVTLYYEPFPVHEITIFSNALGKYLLATDSGKISDEVKAHVLARAKQDQEKLTQYGSIECGIEVFDKNFRITKIGGWVVPPDAQATHTVSASCSWDKPCQTDWERDLPKF